VRSGFTLVELLVVLVVMGLMVGLVAPAIIPRPEPDERDSLSSAIRFAREAAVRRSEVVYLRIDASGGWSIDGASSSEDGPLASGRIDRYGGGAATLVASPIGTCAFDARSSRAAQVFRLDPLTCELPLPGRAGEPAP
jgi:prepilin-type N-terminal cleavage/methylation domain-containing protein